MGLAAFFLLNIDLIVHNSVSLGLTVAIDYRDCDDVLSISSFMLVSLSKFVLLLHCKDCRSKHKIKRCEAVCFTLIVLL